MEPKLIFSAISKKNFYFKMHITKFILNQGGIPLNPFMLFEYFLVDAVNRDKIINANNYLVKKADELWIFGEISNGVLKEIEIAKEMKKPIKYFKILDSKEIKEISEEETIMEK